jgi:hypothetical protein
MISGKLVRLVESHEQEIIDRVAKQIRHDPNLSQMPAILGSGLRQWHRELYESLNHWLAEGDSETMARRFEHVGRERFKQCIPLHECVHNLCSLRENLLDFVEENTFNKDSVELYAEKELDRRVGRFFDLSIVHLVQGYESASGRAAAA